MADSYRRRNRKPQWMVDQEAAEQAEAHRKQEESRRLEDTHENFPPLGKVVTAPQKTWGGSKSFADLAKQWSEKSEFDKYIKDHTTDAKEDDYIPIPIMPVFHNVHRYVEEESSSEEESKQEENSWTRVDSKKYKKQKPAKDESESEKEEDRKQDEDTVWAAQQKEEYETCWDDRRTY